MLIVRMPTTLTSSFVWILDTLPSKLSTPITCAYGTQIRHAWVDWNPISVANKNHLEVLLEVNFKSGANL